MRVRPLVELAFRGAGVGGIASTEHVQKPGHARPLVALEHGWLPWRNLKRHRDLSPPGLLAQPLELLQLG